MTNGFRRGHCSPFRSFRDMVNLEIKRARCAWSLCSRKAKTKITCFMIFWCLYALASIATLDIGPLAMLALNIWLLSSLYETLKKVYPNMFDLEFAQS